MIGVRLAGRYEILREIGRGGMGVVYAARDSILERDVAIKLVPEWLLGPEIEERFRREARVVAKMDHPAIVGIYDIGTHDGALFLVMPFVDGTTLRSLISAGRLSFADTTAIGLQVAQALDYSHTRGVVHRDIKPENIMVSTTGAALRARVLDFGIAIAVTEDRVTKTGHMVGTPAYLSPEQINGSEPDASADLYALGAVLYECLTGQMLFSGRVPAIYHRIATKEPTPVGSLREGVPFHLASAIRACTAKDPALRPKTGRDLVAILQATSVDGEPRPETLDGSVRSTQRTLLTAAQMVGRWEHLAELRTHATSAAAGECHLVLVAGEAGIGKTHLLEAFEPVALGIGARILHGRFVERNQSFPYQGFCDVVHEFVKVTESADVATGGFDELSTLFPSLAETNPGSAVRTRPIVAEPDHAVDFADQAAVFELLSRTIARIAGGKPLVLLLEDLHAADVSIDAIGYIVRRIGPVPVLFVGTYRPEDVGRNHPLSRLVASFRRDSRFAHLKLAPLSRDDQGALVASLVGGEVDPGFLEALYTTTEGNPHYTTELVRSLVGSGGLTRSDDGRWGSTRDNDTAPCEFPETIQQAIEERLSHIDDEGRDLLLEASIIGRAFDLSDLKVIASAPDDLDDALDCLLEAGFLVEERQSRGDRFAFSSGILRDVLYAGLPRRRKRLLHRTLAEGLEVRYQRGASRVLPSLVHHFAQGRMAEKAVRYGLHSARLALDACSPEDALRAGKIALEFLGQTESEQTHEGEIWMLLAAAHRLARDTTQAIKVAGHAVQIFEDANLQIEALRAMVFAAEAAWDGRAVERTRRWVERGLRAARSMCGDGNVEAILDLRLKLLTLGATAANLRGDHAAAARYAAEARDIAPPTADATDNRPMHAASGTIRVAFLPELLHLDPARVTGNVALEALSTVFETLTRQGDGARVVPWLASEFSAEADGTRYRVRLRDGVQFHNGAPVTARDVRWSFERLLRANESESRWLLAPIQGALAVSSGECADLAGFVVESDRDFRIELTKPVSFFPALLTAPPTAIVPFGEDLRGSTWRDGCVGTGPFRVARFSPGRRLDLEANPGYWQSGLPRAKALVFHFGVSPDEIRDGFAEGRYSLARGLPPSDVDALRRESEFASGYHETPQLTTAFVALNARTGPLSDQRLRRRLMAVDTRALVSAALGRTALPACSLVPPGFLGFEKQQKPAARAAEETASDRIGDVELTAIALPGFLDGHYSGLLRAVLDALAGVGFRVRVLPCTQSELESHRAQATTDLCFWGWVADYPDADAFYHGVLHSNAGCVGRYCGSEGLDHFVDLGRVETDMSRRHRIYREIEDTLVEHALLIPISHPLVSCFARPGVHGVHLNVSTPLVSYERIFVDD